MNAVILAAGATPQLGPLTDRTPACLLRVGGRPLLARMLQALETAGIAEALVVLGHGGDQVRAVARRRLGRLAIRYVDSPDRTRDSVLTLLAAREFLLEPVLVIDSDVLLPVEFLRRLRTAAAPTAILVDRAFEDSGEEVKVYARGARVIAVGRKSAPEAWDTVGRMTGLLKCGAEAGPALVQALEAVVTEGGGHGDYEDALDRLAGTHHVGWIDVTGQPWIEIATPEDLHRAETEVLRHIVRQDD